MPTKFDSRQVINHSILARLSGVADTEVDDLLSSINTEVTPPLALSCTGTNRVVSIANILATNAATGLTRTIPPISNLLPTFTSGTVTLSSGGAPCTATPSVGSAYNFSVASGNYIKLGININSAGSLVLLAGTEGASVAAATAPLSVSNTFAIGYVVVHNTGGTIDNITTSMLVQFAGGGGGSGGLATENRTASFTASSGTHALCDTSGGAFTVTLPTGATGNVIRLSDAYRTWGTNNLTITPATGQKIDGLAINENLVGDLSGAFVQLMWNGVHWIVDTNGYAANISSGSLSGGSGTGAINYIGNPDAENSLIGWATYADAAAALPVDGTGGSPTSTYTRNTTTPLRGNADFKWSKGAANRQGEGFSYDFTISTVDRSKKLQISVDMNTSAAAYVASDMTVYVYDVTNSILITPSSISVPKMTGSFAITFDSTTSTSYRLIFHTATTNATAYDLYFDNFIVGPGVLTQGAAVGPWESVTSYTIGADTTPPTPGAGASYYRRTYRDGEYAVIRWEYSQTGAGTAGSGSYRLPLPTGLTIDATKIGIASSSGYARVVGSTGFFNNASTFLNIIAYANGGLTYVYGLVGNETTSPSTGFGSTGGALSGSGTTVFCLEARIPIAEWAGNGTVNLGAGAQEEYAYNTDISATSVITSQASSAYGPQGINFSASWAVGTSYTRRVYFSSPIQVGDLIILEQDIVSSGLVWSETAILMPYHRQGASEYGVYISGQGANYVDVYFAANGALATGATYASNGASFSGQTSRRWRVRKAKPSSPVGFGLASTDGSSGLYKAGSAPGQTTGATIAAGYVGEVYRTSFAGGALTTGVAGRSATITLPSAGVWLVQLASSFTGTATSASYRQVSANTTDAISSTYTTTSTFVVANDTYNPSTAVDYSAPTPPLIVNSSSAPVIYIWAKATFSGGTFNNYGYVTAVRIA